MNSANSAVRPAENPLVYAVDDTESLTELYSVLLTDAGYAVRTFHHRSEALAALQDEGKRPALLITDYLGLSMPVDQFMQACRLVHPRLRILMATGFEEATRRLSCVRPDRLLRKPFTPEEFLQEVKTALAA